LSGLDHVLPIVSVRLCEFAQPNGPGEIALLDGI
jgi:hypothetical protein